MNIATWKQTFINIYNQIIDGLITFLPHLLTTVLVISVGIIIAIILGRLTEKFIIYAEQLVNRFWHNTQNYTTESYVAKMARRVMFWVVLLFFFIAALQVIDWPLLNKLVGDFTGYLPKLIVGLLVIFAGFIVGNMLYNMIRQTKANFEQRFLLGRALQIAIILTAVLVGIEQIGINIDLLVNLMLVIVGVFSFGFVLTFALATKTSASNLLAMKQCQHICLPGSYLKINNFEGYIVELTATQVVLETKDGVIYIPAEQLQNQIFILGKKEAK